MEIKKPEKSAFNPLTFVLSWIIVLTRNVWVLIKEKPWSLAFGLFYLSAAMTGLLSYYNTMGGNFLYQTACLPLVLGFMAVTYYFVFVPVGTFTFDLMSILAKHPKVTLMLLFVAVIFAYFYG